ncbi:MAG TPA: DMT family transporter [Kofleriaceae bacterium]|nr:DMT family transporter [Kofleriaceae bacterium]
MAVVACYLICALVWSTTWFAIRVCIGPGGYPTFPAAAMRFTIAALILVALVKSGLGRPGPRSRRQWVALVVAGLCNAVGYAAIYRAEESLPGGLVAVLFGTYPLFTALAAAATGTERIRRVDLGAALLSLVGMAVLFWDRLSISSEQAIGVAFAMAGVFGSVAYNVIFKREAGGVHPLSATAVFLSVGAVALWGLALPTGVDRIPVPLPMAPTVALFYLAILGSVVTFVCYFYLLRRVSLMTASSLVLVQPVIALLVDALWEDEVRLVARSYAGAAITLAGVALGLVWKWRVGRRAAASAATPA